MAQWRCDCDCGALAIVTTNSLRRGVTMSCGCLHRDRQRVLKTTHGDFRSKLYKVWTAMWQRCRNRHDKRFKDYGGRGIVVCDEWRDYVVFRAWALATGYHDGKSIDRIDNNGDYQPDNCRWVTAAEQQSNMRSNRAVIRSDGRRYSTAASAARDVGVDCSSICKACRGKYKTTGGFSWRYA